MNRILLCAIFISLFSVAHIDCFANETKSLELENFSEKEKNQLPPTITMVAADEIVECNGFGNRADLDAWLDIHGGAIATSASGAITWSYTFTGRTLECGGTSTATYHFFATDATGTVSAGIADFIIVDSTAPSTSTMPAPTVVECGTSNTTQLETWRDNNGGYTATDICSLPLQWNYEFVSNTSGCGGMETHVYRFMVTDACGNMSTAGTSSFVIQDTTDPTINCPVNQIAECGSDTSPAILGMATGTDFCSSTTVNWSDDSNLVISCPTVETITRTWTITDDCGNTNSCIQVITLEDNFPPVVTTAPQDMMVECDGSLIFQSTGSKKGLRGTNTADFNAWLNSNGGAIAKDSCVSTTNLQWTCLKNAPNGGCGTTVDYTVEFFVQDQCNPRVSAGIATFSVIDMTGPTITNPASALTVDCAADTASLKAAWLANNGGATASDFCSSTISWTNESIAFTDNCGATKVQRYRFIAMDGCGNSSVAGEVDFTITDTTAPVWSNSLPGDLEIQCNTTTNTTQRNNWIASWTNTALASDFCGSVVSISDVLNSIIVGSCAGETVETYTFTATDECGNTASQMATLTINDDTDPIIVCPANTTISCTNNSDPINTGFPTISDNCGTPNPATWNDMTAAGSCPIVEIISRTWSVTDVCGNTATCLQTIERQDLIAPVPVSMVADESVTCDGNGNLLELAAWVANNAGASAIDDCGTVNYSPSEDATPDGCSGTGCYTYTFTATDLCGNFIILGPADFCITDNSEPQITTSASDMTVNCDGSGNTTQLQNWIDNNGGAIASDDCSANLSWSFSNNTPQTNCGNTTVTTYEFTVTDDCTNSSVTTANFIIQDITAPVWSTLPTLADAECDGAGNTTELADFITAWSQASNITEACGLMSITPNFIGTTTDPNCPGAEQTHYQFEAIDECGNSTIQDAYFNINDTQAPSINCPASVAVSCNADVTPAALGSATGTDDCDLAPVVGFSDNDVTLSACLTLKTRTWLITDACGNANSCDQVITIQDDAAPNVMTPPQNVDHECDGTLVVNSAGSKKADNLTEFNTWLTTGGNAVVSDDCGNGVNWQANYVSDTNDCGGTSSYTYSFTVSDNCGNSAFAGTATFSIVDTQAPTIMQAPTSMTVECDGSGNTMQFDNWVATNAGATATDPCSATITWTQTMVSNTAGLGGTYVAVYAFQATDLCLNSSVPMQATFTVEDTTRPDWIAVSSLPGNRTVECDGSGNLADLTPWLAAWESSANGTDGCGDVTVTAAPLAPLAATCPNVTVQRYRMRLEDENGNFRNRTATFTINDTTDPIANCPTDANVNCGDDTTTTALGTATGTDACGSIVSVTFNDNSVAGTCPILETITRTWTVTDECGLTGSCDQIIIVRDNGIPNFSSDPVSMTVQCDGTGNTTELNNWLANNGGAVVTDDCGAVTFVKNRISPASGCGITGCHIYSFTAFDACGNSLPLSNASFCIEDNSPPTFSAQAENLDVNCSANLATEVANWVAANGNATATDLCGSIIWTDEIITPPSSCTAGVVTTTYRFTATDECGLSASTTANLNVRDNTAPVWLASVSLPGNTIVECDGADNLTELNLWLADWENSANATDDCGNVTISSATMSATQGICPENIVTVYVFTATDDCGNSSTETASFTIQDTTMPGITCPPDVTINCSADFSPASLGTAGGSDNCSTLNPATFSDDTAAGTCPVVATISRTWTVTDACNNSNSCIQTIVRNDTQGPTPVLFPTTMTVECDGNGNTTELNAWLANAGGGVATDDCGTVTYSSAPMGSTSGCGSTDCQTFEFTATDNCGNDFILGMADFCIEDNTNPQINLSATTMIVECDGNGNTAELTAWLAARGNATATDACDDDLVWTNPTVLNVDQCAATSVTTYQFTVTDDCGNFSVTTAEFRIEDNTRPDWIVVPSDVTVQCDGLGNTDAFNDWIAEWNDQANITESCSNGNVDVQRIALSVIPNCGATNVTTYQFTATDACGNFMEETGTFTIIDTQNPTISCPAAATVSCNGDVTPAALGMATGTDNCTIPATSFIDSDNQISLCLTEKTRTWTVTDDCGLTATCDQVITIEDTDAPTVVSGPTPLVLECDGTFVLISAGSKSADNVTEINNWLTSGGGAVVTDDCTGNLLNWNWIFDPNPVNNCGGTVVHTVTFTVSDACGNLTTAGVTTLTVEDNTAPVISTPAVAETVECDGSGNMTELNTWLAANGNAVADDVCGDVTWTNRRTNIMSNCGLTSVATYEFTATDECGNFDVTIADFTIEDTTPPVWNTTPANIAIQCDGTGNPNEFNTWIADWKDGSEVSDLCSNSVTVDENLIGFDDNCGGTSVRTYEFTATDDCGRTAVATGTFSIIDTEIPTATCPANATINCNADASPNVLGLATGNDNCSLTTDISFTETIAIGATCAPIETISRIWSVSDECGNTATCLQTIERTDTEQPNIINSPTNLTVECDGTGNQTDLDNWLLVFGNALASDDCGTVTYSYISAAPTTACGLTACTAYTFTATDMCGNIRNLGVASFCIEDNTAPAITPALTETVECDGNGNQTELDAWRNANGNATATDICDQNALTWNYSVINTTPSCNGNLVTMTHQFTVTDICGKSASTTADFIIEDTTAPVWDDISLPGNLTVQCNGSGNTDQRDAWIADWIGSNYADDACTDVTVASNLLSFNTGACFGTSAALYEFTATDECGNASTRNATFTVEDSTMPTLACPPVATVNCASSIDPSVTGFATASDNCGGGATPTYTDATATGTCPIIDVTTRMWTIADQCGNSDNCIQMITRQDIEAPAFTTAPQDVVVNCSAGGAVQTLQNWIDNAGNAVITDNCGNFTTTSVETATPTNCGVNDCFTYEFTATDDCGNITFLGEADYCVIDDMAPVITSFASDRTVQCNGTGNIGALNNWLTANGNAIAADACGSVTWSNVIQTGPTALCGNTSTTTYEFTATDDCGNSVSTTAVFRINDTQIPTINCPANISGLTCMGDISPAILGEATATDNCAGTITPTFSDIQVGNNCTANILRTWTADDGCGNTADCIQNIQLQDVQPPMMTTPAVAASAECDGTGNATDLNAWLDNNGGMIVTDDCGAVTWSANLIGQTPGCGSTTISNYRFTATDACNNSVSSTATFTLTDITPPTASIEPADISLDCNAGNTSITLTNWLANAGGAVASDLCGNVSWSNVLQSSTASCVQGFTDDTYLFTLTDDCNNSSTYTATFSVSDNTAPTFTNAPVSATAECDGNGNTADINNWLAVNAGATATDDCGNATITSNFMTINGICGGSESHVYQFTATDGCGNATTQTAQFSILDSTDPILVTAASDLNISCGTNASLALQSWLAGNGGAVVGDLCGNVTWSRNVINTIAGCAAGIDETVYEFTAIDDCGNSVSTIASYIISDSENPTFTTTPQPMTVECDGTGNTIELNNWLANNAGATATDDCGIPTLSSDFEAQNTICGNSSATIYTFSATDGCGNVTSATATFTITDNTLPIILAQAQDAAGGCANGGDLSNWIVANGGASANDVCGNITWTNEIINQSAGCVGGTISYTYRFTATDDCSNAASTTAIFTATDNTAPVFSTLPQNEVVECNGAGNVAAFNTWFVANANAIATDGCGTVTITSAPLTDISDCDGAVSVRTYNFTATDDCGNSTSASASFTIEDTTAPSLSANAIDGTGTCTVAGDLSTWLANNGGAAATDICSDVTWTNAIISQSPTCVAGAIDYVYEFTATDDCGNDVSTTATFSVVDNTAPVFATLPQSLNVQCNSALNGTELNNWLAANGNAIVSDACGTVTVSNTLVSTTDDCNSTVSTRLYTFTAMDDCGNAVSADASFVIIDSAPPVLSVQAVDASGSCDVGTGLTTWLANNGGAVANDLCGSVTWTNQIVSQSSTCTAGSIDYTYRFTAADDCGNSISTTAVFSEIDNVAPVFALFPENVNVDCDGSGNNAEFTTWLNGNAGATATDVCGNVTISSSFVSDLANCNGSISARTYTFTATDDCGNATTANATFNIFDNTAPNISAQAADATGTCGNAGDLTGWLNANGGAIASDNCSNVIWTNVLLSQTPTCINGSVDYVYEFTATDDCGNASTTTATYSEIDNIAPVFTTLPQSMSVQCDGAGNLTDFNNWLAANASAAAFDACSSVTISGTPESNTPNCNGSTSTRIYTFTATDDCGNATTANATFTILDNTPPTITAQAQDGNGTCVVSGDLANWLSNNGGATATDVCGSVTWSNIIIAQSPACVAGAISYTYLFTAVDDCGNAATTTAVFSVVDNTAPVFAVLPQNASAQCDGAGNLGDLNNWLASGGNATATDACGTVTITSNFVSNTPACGNTSTSIYNFTATDDCGNATTESATFTILDAEGPIFAQEAQNTTGLCTSTMALDNWVTANGLAVATDNCGGAVTWTNNFISQTPTCTGGSTDFVYEFTATDICGNASVTTATFSLIDNVVPVFSTLPQDASAECDGAGNLTEMNNWLNTFAGMTATDVCGSVTYSSSQVSITPACDGSTSVQVYEFSATDNCGNVATATASFTILDTTDPVIAQGAMDMTYNCSGGASTQIADWLAMNGGATATDVCGSLTWTNAMIASTNDCAGSGTLTETYEFTATDGCGNSATTTATITLNDNTPPTFTTAPMTMSVQCDGTGNHFQLKQWLQNNAGAVATDDCSNFAVSGHFIDEVDGCGNTKTYNYEFTAIDMCGNATTLPASFIVMDNMPPNITTAASDGSGTCGTSTDLTNWLAANGGASASDNCSNVTWTNQQLSQTNTCVAGALDYVYQFTATDECGNAISTTATFSVIDNDAPIFTTLPQNETVECDGLGNTAAFNVWVATNAGAIAIDACGTVSYSAAPLSTTATCVGNDGQRVYGFTATDNCGNATTRTATFTINDSTVPTLSAQAADASFSCGGNTATLISNWVASNGGATATDVCGSITWTNALIASNNDCSTNGMRTETYRFTATDDCGNAVSTTATVSLVDNTAPVFATAPQSMTVQCNGNGNHFQLKTWLQNNAGATATDACSNFVIGSHLVDEVDGCGGTKTYNYRFTAVDECGNFASSFASFIIIDSTPPTILAQATDGSGTCGATGDLANWLAANGGASASDNCSNVSWTNQVVSQTNTCVAGAIDYVYQFTATDECGNAISTTATFSVIDNDAPIFTTLPQNETVECDGLGNTAAFNAWVATNAGAIAIDGCGTVSYSAAPLSTTATCVGNDGQRVYGFTATDNCGNATTRTATFTINDSTVPTLSAQASDASFSCGGNTATLISNWVASNGGATATDVCGSITWTNALIASNNDCSTNGMRTETYRFTATDDCGNAVSTTATVSLVDNTAPVFATAPQGMTIQCNGSGNHFQFKSWLANNAGATATDACSNFVIASHLVSEIDGCGGTKTYNYEFTAVDECGNSASAFASFSIIDNVAPTILAQAGNATGTCDGSGTSLNTWLAANGGAAASDDCGLVTWANTLLLTSGDCSTGGIVSTYQFTAIDECGNASNTTGTFTLTDNTAPTFTTLPQDLQFNCTGDLTALNNWIANNGGAVATDLCGNVTWSAANIGAGGTCTTGLFTTYEFTATDDCGNAASQTANYMVIDNTPPVWNFALNFDNIECDGNGNQTELNDFLAQWAVASNATDACTSVTISSQLVSSIQTGTCAGEREDTYVFNAVDACGNIASTVGYFRTVDNTAPAITCPADASVDCSGDTSPAALGTATATDLCSPNIVFGSTDVTNTGNCQNAIVRTWTATDACGNAASCNQTISLDDTQGPTFVRMPSQSVYEYFTAADGACHRNMSNPTAVNEGGGCWQVHFDLADGQGNPKGIYEYDGPCVIDDCGIMGIPILSGTRITQTDCFSLWNVSWRFTDDCGNFTDYTQTFTFVDQANPVWQQPNPMLLTADCNADIDAMILANQPTALDNCSVTVSEIDREYVAGSCAGEQEVIVRYRAFDPCQNAAASLFEVRISIEDTDAPTWDDLPGDMNRQCNGTSNTNQLNNWISDWTDVTNVTDVCGNIAGIDSDLVSFNFGACNGTGVWTYEFTATDDCGNASTQTAIFTVTDTRAPDIVCPADIAVLAGGSIDPSNTGTATATDLCSQFLFPAIYTDVSVPGTTPGAVTVITRTWSVTDLCGNTETCDQIITITDSTPPVWDNTFPVTVTTNCDQDINVIIADNQPTATDGCGVNYDVVTDVTVTGACAGNFTRTLTYEVSDNCGNTNPTTVDLIIIATDIMAPTWVTLPRDTAVECRGNGHAADIQTWLTTYAGGLAMDFCGSNTMSYFPVDTTAHCGTTASYQFGFVATDDCANADTLFATLMFIDTTAPRIIVPAQNIVASCDGTNNKLNQWISLGGGAVITDNCSDTIAWRGEIISQTNNVCDRDTAVYRLIADDLCGNVDTTQALFISFDDKAPILVGVPNDTLIDCTMSVPPVAAVTIMDCDPNATLTFVETNTGTSPDTIYRVWTGMDCNGLMTIDTQLVIEKPSNPPTVVFCTPNVGPVISQNGSCVVANWTPPIFNADCGYTVTSTHNPGDCFPVGITTVTYTATDVTGNSVTCSFTVEITDFCQPIVHNSNNFFIQKFVFNGVESTTGDNGGYINLTNVSSTVQQGQNVILTLQPGPNVNTFGYWRVWIDWTGDGDFTDPSEMVVQLSGQGLMITQVTIPSNAILGEKRIRVTFHHSRFMESCDPISDSNGEMEDYTLYVIPHLKPIANDPNTVQSVPASAENTSIDRISEAANVFEFAATPIDGKTDLKWIADQSEPTDRFVIERSNDGINFKQLMTVKSDSNGSGDLFYKTKDKNPLIGENYYRLKQILTDGTVIYSNLQKVIFEEATIEISFYPNPTSGILNIEMFDLVGQSGRVTILNQLGQNMMHFDLSMIEKVTQLDLNNLPDGVYYVRVSVGDFETTEKIFLKR